MNFIIAMMNTSGLVVTFAFIRKKEREVNLDVIINIIYSKGREIDTINKKDFL